MRTKKNKNFIEYENKIVNAFISLLKQDKISHISVAQIIKTAKITRPTFYLHFKGVEEIYKVVEDMIVFKLSNFLSKNYYNYSKNNLEIQLALAKEIKCNQEFYRAIVSTSHFGEIANKLCEVCYTVLLKKANLRSKEIKNPVSKLWNKAYSFNITNSIIQIWVSFLRNNLKVNYDFIAYWCADYIEKINFNSWKKLGLRDKPIDYLKLYYKQIKK